MPSSDAKSRYALLAAMDLAAHYETGKPVKVREIAARTSAPANYLVHILLRLKRRALVRSTRGAAGGYALIRPPEMISAAEVIAAVGPADRRRRAAADAPAERAVGQVLDEGERHRRLFLARVTLADLVAGSSGA